MGKIYIRRDQYAICVAAQRIDTYRQNDNKQEVHVCNVMELEPQVLGQETYGCVLGRSDLIAFVLHQRVTLLVLGLRW